MSKQKVIETAYGDNWELLQDWVDDNGWCLFKVIGHGVHEGFEYDEVGLSRSDVETKDNNGSGFYLWRPKTLSNLEFNNGWTEIKSIEDIPNEDYVYWVMRKDVKVPLYRKVEAFTIKEKHYWLTKFSHYQRISKPSPPVY